MDGPEIRQLVDGAAYLFTNEYEAALTEQKTGWTSQEILDRVGARVTTLGKKGAIVERSGRAVGPGDVPARGSARSIRPGSVTRSALASSPASAWGLSDERCAQVGAMLATYVIETVGTQEYDLGHGQFLDRFTEAYGAEAAADITAHLRLIPA